MPTTRRRHAITETPRVQVALDALRSELGGARPDLGELVVLGAEEKIARLRAADDRAHGQRPTGGLGAQRRAPRRARGGRRGPPQRLGPPVSGRLLLDNSAWARLSHAALPDAARERVAGLLDQQRIAVCLPFLLEAGCSARDARDHDQLFSAFGWRSSAGRLRCADPSPRVATAGSLCGMSRSRLAVAGLASVLALAALPAVADAEQVTIRSFDGTAIDADFQPADGLRAGERAPTIVMTHGFGATRETLEIAALAEPLGQVPAAAFRARGYNTITYDSRGFGRSGGEIDLDSPDREGRDASAVVDYVATRGEAQLDAAGDPRVGMHGASYGGGVQWAAASRDRRIDALAPSISWTSLVQALARDGRLKLGWGLALVGLGETSGLALGAFAPQGLELGAFPVELLTLAAKGAVTGRADTALTGYLRTRSTGDGIANVRAPSLIVQGTADTLFTPSQSLEMRRLLRRAGVPTKVLWFCGGHGVCRTGSGGASIVQPRVLAWMDRWMKGDTSARIGPGFEWVADDGKLRAAADLPLRSAGTITATGSGTLPITPVGTASGLVVAATRAVNAVEVPVPAQAAAKDVVGEPVVRLRYRGTSTAPDAHLYAQLVDEARGVVVGNQTTPIPVTLDGRTRVVERSLEAVAMRVTPGSRYRLQVSDGSNVYGLTTGVGGVELAEVGLTLPVGDAARTVADPALTGVAPPAAAPAAAGAPARTVTKRLRLRSLRRPGVLLRGTTATARRTRASLVVSAATAKRLGLRVRTIASGRTAKRRVWSLRLRPSARVATALRRRATVTATVRVSSGTVRPNRVVVRR